MKIEYYMMERFRQWPLRKFIDDEEYFWIPSRNVWTKSIILNIDHLRAKKITEEEAFRYMLEN